MKTKRNLLSTLMLILLMLCMHVGSAQSISYDAYYELSAGFTLNNSYSVASQEGFSDAMTFSPDGSRLFIIGAGSKAVQQYSLSIPFDLSSTITHNGSYSVSTQDALPTDVEFTSDGMTMFVLGQNSRTVYEYSLSVAYDITSTVNLTANSFFFGTRQSSARAIVFSPDGMTLWIGGGFSSGSIDEFALTSPYDISSASAFATSDGLDGLWDDGMYDMEFSPDGTRLYTIDGATNGDREIIEFEVSVPFDLTSTFTVLTTFDLSTEETLATGLTLPFPGNQLFLVGRTSDNVKEFNITNPSYNEGAGNDGSISGSRRTFSLTGETFTNAGSTLTYGVDFSISNLPVGLTAVIAVESDGTSGTLSFSGAASNHQFNDGVSDLIFTFNNSAFVGGDASAVSNSTSANSGIPLNFRDNAGPFLSYDTYGDFAGASKETTTFSVASQEVTPQGLAFSDDGLKAFVVGSTSDEVYQYNLTNPFDITTGVTYSNYSLDVSNEELAPLGLTFHPDGTKLYLVGGSGDINQYSLSTGFDLNSTVTFDGSPFNLSGEMTSPQGIAFNPDGTKMFICGTVSSAGRIFEYTLTNPYDVTTGGSFTTDIPTGSILTDLAFDTDGKTLYGTFSNSIREYSLPASYTITYGATLEETHVTGVLGTSGLSLNRDRSGFFIVGFSADEINQFNLTVDNLEESFTNDGSVTTRKTIQIVDGFFANPGGILTHGIHFTATGVPAGLTPSLSVATDGLSAEMSLEGNATSHQIANNSNDIVFTFNDIAFNGNTAADVANAVSGSSHYLVTFIEPNPVIFVNSAFDITNQLNLVPNEFSLRTNSSTPFNPTWSSDGTRLFVVDQTNDAIDQYNVTVPFETKLGMTIAGTYSVTSEESTPYAVQFSSNGSKMFIMGSSSDRVHQYSLTTPFDITSGVSYDEISFDVSAFEVLPFGLTFSSTGQRMYIIGQDEDMIFQFKLPKAFDLSATPIYLGSYEQSLEVLPTALYISPNGDRMLFIGTNRDRVYQLNLTEKFDVTSAVYNNEFFSVTSTSNTPSGITFSPSGKQMYITGSNFDRIGQFNLALDSDFTETAANQGEVEGSFSFGLIGDKFTNSGSSLTYLTHFTVSNLPSGLTPVMSVSVDGAEAILTFSGAASSHQNANDVAAFEVTFLDGAFVSGDASAVTNATFGVDVSIDFNNNPSLTFVNGYNSDSEITFNDEFYIGNNESQPNGIAFSADGLTAFVVGTNGNEVNQYALNEPFDITAGISFSGIFNLGAGTASTGIFFDPTGTKLFVIGFGLDRIYQYALTTPFHVISGASLESTADVGTEDQIPHGLAISRDGDKLFMIGNINDAVFQYSLGSNFDISGGITYDNISYSIAGQETSPGDIQFSPDGKKMYIIGSSSDQIHQYNLSNPYDISIGVTYEGVILDISEQEGAPVGFTYGKDGSRIFVVGNFEQEIIQYELTADGFNEIDLNNGTVDGLQGIQLFDDTFVNPAGALTIGTHYTITGVPSGLTPSINVNASGDFATLTLSGQASDNQNTHDVGNLEISFLDAAFAINDASDIFNSTNQMIAGIDFDDNNPTLIYGDLYDLSRLSFMGNSASTTSEDTGMRAIAFNNDGTKMFLLGANTDEVHDYTLSSPFDVTSGISATGISHSIGSEENFGTAIVFNPEGSSMFILGFDSDEIHQYSLSTPFNISSGVSLVTSFSVSSQDSAPTGLTFNPDGTKMYVIGQDEDEILQYTLDTPFDLTGNVSYDGNPFPIGSYNGVAWGIQFSPDGSKLLISGSSSDRITMFEMNRPFDVTAGGSFASDFNLRNQDNASFGMTFSADGSRLFVVGANDGDINQYEFSYDQFKEGSKNDGAVDGEQTIFVIDDQFVNASGTLSSGTHFTINNLPAGLNPILNVDADGSGATLTFDSNSTVHQDVNDVDGLEFTFVDAAFVGGDASLVANANVYVSPFDIDFRDNNPALLYGNTLDLAHATIDPNNYDMSAQDYPGGMGISADGSKVFLCSDGGSSIYQYTLSTPYDISAGLTYNGFFDTSSEDFSVYEVQFSTDGMKMFTLGHDNYSIYQYNLTTPFDITTGVTYSGNTFYFEDYGTDVYALAFNADGSKMYFASTQRFEVIQLSLSSSYDLSSVSDDGNPLDIEAIGSPMGMAFSADGRYLLMAEDEDDYSVVRYTLNAPFDVTAGGSFDGVFFDLNTPNIWGTGIAINPDGSRFFVSDGDNGLIHQVDIDLGGFAESAGNDGSLEGELNIIIFDEPFTNTGGTLVHGTDYTINNLPSGLSPLLNVDVEGYSANLTFSGSADIHGDAQDIAGLEFTFNNSAFGNGDAGAVANAASHDSEIGIDFAPYSENDITSFTFGEINGVATINDVEATVDAEAVAGTDVSAIIPTIGVSPNASIAPNTGIVQDFTSAVTYTVTAEDGSIKDWDITITESLAAPTDIAISASSIDENLLGNSTVGTLTTTDASFNDNHSYTLVAGDGDTDNASFNINEDNLRTSFSGDFETKSVYSVRVQTDDGQGGTFARSFTISINDVNEEPTDMDLSATTIDESSAIGTMIGALSTVDEDQSDTHTYTLVSGTGDADNASFDIVDGNLVSAEVFDFETRSNYSVRVQTEDAGGLTRQEEFTITVNDLPPQVTSVELDDNTVAENEDIGTMVGNFSTLGEDLSGSYTYTLVSGMGDTDNASFSISGSQLLTAESFNFESTNSYSIRMKTDDGTGNTLESAFTISITDVLESSDANITSFVLAEQTGDATIDTPNRTVSIEVVRGTDLTNLTPAIAISGNATASPATGVAQDFTNPLTYTLTAQDDSQQTWTVTVTAAKNTATDILTFSFPEQTGAATIDAGAHTVAIEVATGTGVTSLTPTITLSEAATISPNTDEAQDFSNTVTYTVTAEDGSTTQDWTVTVSVKNGVPSVTDATFTLDENAPAGTSVGTVAASDPESSTLSFAITAGNTNETFEIDSSTGEIKVKDNGLLDFETTPTFSLIVTASDGTDTGSGTITINLNDVSEGEATYSVSGIATANGTGVTGTIAALDVDDATQSYETELGADGTFSISLLPTGTYTLLVSPDNADFVPTYLGGNSPVLDPSATFQTLEVSSNVRGISIEVASAPESAVETVENGGVISFQAISSTNGRNTIVEGRVENGTPVPNTLVILYTSDGEFVASALTDENGFVTFDGLPNGEYELVVEIPGVGRQSAMVGVALGEETEVTGMIGETGITLEIVKEAVVLNVDQPIVRLNVYPNPVSDELHISGLEAGYRIQLINLQGQVVRSFQATTSISLDLRGLPSGIYLLQVSDLKNGIIHNNRVIKR